MLKTVIVLPTYNEKENLALMIEALFALNLDNLHILVVDDNSPDGTGKIADDFASRNPKVTVLHRKEKNGLGQAYIAGFKQALKMDADYIIQMDCDFSHQPKYIPELLKAIETNDLVIGSRFAKGGSVDENWSAYRKLLTWFANRSSAVSDSKIITPLTGCKAASNLARSSAGIRGLPSPFSRLVLVSPFKPRNNASPNARAFSR